MTLNGVIVTVWPVATFDEQTSGPGQSGFPFLSRSRKNLCETSTATRVIETVSSWDTAIVGLEPWGLVLFQAAESAYSVRLTLDACTLFTRFNLGLRRAAPERVRKRINRQIAADFRRSNTNILH